ncbi:tRNA (adenosine(37)-N6)-dimethylallyltransferase MiaA [Rhodobacteraceae bacterium CCMM004]|nr:tRNA (adenosine(37)-N6)-dimethylallyltransferase MiaA [Rhodobacteraceae bacterium CCMM004]
MTPDEAVAAATPGRTVLIAGPTASGKSALALRIAARTGGPVVNADALQVYGHWRVLTARPSAADEAAWPHRLYGHVGREAPYSAGHWLRDVAPLLDAAPVIVGGTGLYLTALTEGLAHVPEVPGEVRARGDALLRDEGLGAMAAALDAETAAGIDLDNPARVQRAWEVLQATGRGLARWQAETGPPLLPPTAALCLVIAAPAEDLTPRIAARFDAMLAAGALDEVRAALPDLDPARPGDRAIGAAELAAYLRGEVPLDVARDRAVIATRQYAKRQRSWFRSRMKDWQKVDLSNS